MASTPDMEGITSPDRSETENREEIVAVELPAPQGWIKKFTPKKGGALKRNDIVFISPTGEEIRSKIQLEQYLKSHSGGPSSSEFDWGTGETPRRSARISDKVKATESPEGEPENKREKRLTAAKGAEEKDGETEAPEDIEAATATEEPKVIADAVMKEAEDGGNKVEDVAIKKAGANEGSVEQKKDEEEVENPQISKSNSDVKDAEDEILAEQKEKPREDNQ